MRNATLKHLEWALIRLSTIDMTIADNAKYLAAKKHLTRALRSRRERP